MHAQTNPKSTFAYSIKRWSSRFENAQSRRTKDPNHTLTPHELDSTQLEYLMKQDGGPLALAVWHILIQVATRCPQRGLLVNEEGPLTDQDIAKACHLSEEQVARAIELLTSDPLDWVDIVECPRQVLVTGSLRSGRNGRPKVPEVIPVKGIQAGPDFHIERLITVVEHTPEGASSPEFKTAEVLPYEFEILLNPKKDATLEHKKGNATVLEHRPEDTLLESIMHWNKKHNLLKVNSLSVNQWMKLMQWARQYPTMNDVLLPAIDKHAANPQQGGNALTFVDFIFMSKEKVA